MELQRIAAIATIIGTLFAGLQLFGNQTPATAASVSALEKSAQSIDLSLKLPVYQGERKWLLAMFDAAKEMPYTSSKDDALKKVVGASIKVTDFNMAILAAKESPYASSKAELLTKIVDAAIGNKDTVGYAVVAANSIPYSSTKSDALAKIVSSYERFSQEVALPSSAASAPSAPAITARK